MFQRSIIWCFFCLVFFNPYHIESQTKKIKGSINYMWILKSDGTKLSKGFLESTSDREITYIKKNNIDRWMSGDGTIGVAIPISEIDKLSFRKSGKVTKGMIWGGLIGGLTLGVIGYITNDCNNCLILDKSGAFKVGIIFGTPIGALLGAAVGARKNKFLINGDYNSFKRQEDRIKKNALKVF